MEKLIGKWIYQPDDHTPSIYIYPEFLLGISSTKHLITYSNFTQKLLLHNPINYPWDEYPDQAYSKKVPFNLQKINLKEWKQKPMKNLIGKYAVRTAPFIVLGPFNETIKDYSYTNDPLHIISVNSDGSFECKTKFLLFKLFKDWDDGKWVEVPSWLYYGKSSWPLKEFNN